MQSIMHKFEYYTPFHMIIRPWEPSDAPSLALHANDIAIAQFMNNVFPHPYSLQDAEVFIAKQSNASPTHIFAITANGEAVGGIGIFPQADIMCKNAELGYWLGKAHWRQGLTSKAVKEIIPYAFANFDITRIYARAFGNNIASQRLLEHCGFVKEAHIKDAIFKLGQFQDELVYAVRRPL